MSICWRAAKASGKHWWRWLASYCTPSTACSDPASPTTERASTCCPLSRKTLLNSERESTGDGGYGFGEVAEGGRRWRRPLRLQAHYTVSSTVGYQSGGPSRLR